VVYFSSIAIDDRPPRWGLAPYVASKVALESAAQAWQGEHPEVSFTTLAIGDTLSGKIEDAPPLLVADLVPRWTAAGLMPGRLMEPESVAEQVVNVLASRETVRRLAITPTAP
jgi:NAD(P)-dependent dehydrogenase (short-subunit alcohol dehydrogenase family)